MAGLIESDVAIHCHPSQTAGTINTHLGTVPKPRRTGKEMVASTMVPVTAHAAGHSFAEALELESRMMTLTGGTDDHAAAVAAFLAKEKPVFEGR